MSLLENGLKVAVLTQSANFFFPDTLRVTGSAMSTPKSYDEHPRQVRYGSPPPGGYEIASYLRIAYSKGASKHFLMKGKSRNAP